MAPQVVETKQHPAPPLGPIGTFFDHTVKGIFTHVGQMLTASLVVAAGTYAVKSDSFHVAGLFDPHIAGYIITAAGFALLGLNFLQGLYQLAKLRHPWVFQSLLIALYMFVSLRAAQLFVAFRNGS